MGGWISPQPVESICKRGYLFAERTVVCAVTAATASGQHVLARVCALGARRHTAPGGRSAADKARCLSALGGDCSATESTAAAATIDDDDDATEEIRLPWRL